MFEIKGLVETILRDHGVEVISVAADHALVRLPGQTGVSTLRFDSLQRLLLSAPVDRWAEIADQHVCIALEAGARGIGRPEVDDILPRVGPINRDKSLAAPWEEWLVEGHLRLRLVVDLPSAVRYVRPLDLVTWELSLFDAKQIAVDNLLARTPADVLEPIGTNSFAVRSGDSYDATRVLLTESWFPDHAGAFAILPARDLLLLVPAMGRDDAQRAAVLWSRTFEDADRMPYPISRGLFWFAPRQEGRVIQVEKHGSGEIVLALPDDIAGLLDVQ